MKKILLLITMIFMANIATFAQHRHYANQGGHYRGGHGSSHKGGHYRNARTHNHYTHHRH